ncbi:hypothetical protein ACETIH_16835 [Microvirga arabica]|uniref:Copper chaperone PCu(A)C n=1 Tax=Microvirga arabica TaxID=1128671 RepID=A0ABV6YAP3_9HYPH
MHKLRNLIVGVAATAAVSIYSIFLPCSAVADDEGAVLGEVALSNIAATPARAGETTIITFSIENAGSDRILITGLQMPGGEPARIMGSFGQAHSGDIGPLPVRPGATEQLDGRRIWIEVGPLTQDLEPDSTINARLVLDTFESPLSLHVGPVATGSTAKANTPSVVGAAETPATTSDRRVGC